MNLEPNAYTVLDKARNIALAFLVSLIWILLVRGGLSYLFDSFSSSNKPDFIQYLVFSIILAPLWEELAFRVIPITIANILNPKLLMPVVLLSSLIFGWGHGYGTISLLIQGVSGFLISLVYIKNNYSYWSVVILHALWNTFVYILL